MLRQTLVMLLVVAAAGCMSGPIDGEVDETFETLCTSGGLASDDANNLAPAGTIVTWTATSGCDLGDTPEYSFWSWAPGGSWTNVRPWSTTNTYVWDTTGAASGEYQFQVWIRATGSPSTYETYTGSAFSIQAGDPCTSVSAVATPSGQTTIGTTVSITNSATCGASTPEFRTWRRAPGGAWAVVQDWTMATGTTWDTTGATAGTYQYQVWARASGSTASYEAYTGFAYGLGNACTAITSSASPSSPTLVGNTVTVSGSATCGGTPTYRFWMQSPGGTWSEVQAYSTGASYIWNTTGAAAGTYRFQIWARNQGSTAGYEVFDERTYDLNASTPCTGAGLVSAPIDSGAVGTLVNLTASSASCGSAEYRFFELAPGGSWTEIQGYGADDTYAWDTLGNAPGWYQFQVWVRQAGSNTTWETWAGLGFTLTP